jgi:hypothetical protein
MCNLDLIGLKCFSEPLAGNLYIEDYVGINTTELAMVADEHTLTGRALGEQILKISKNKVLGDLAFAQTNVSAKSTVDNMINTYGFNNYVVTGTGGVKIIDTSYSKYSVTSIKEIRFKPKFDGLFTIQLNDGFEIKEYQLNAVKDTICMASLDYSTTRKSVIITNEDPLLEFYNIEDFDKSCKPCSGKKSNLAQSGVKDGAPSNILYKFIISASLTCDISGVLCDLIFTSTTKNLLTNIIAIQFGIEFYTKLMQSRRINEMTVTQESAQNFIGVLNTQYREKMFGINEYGKKTTKGMVDILHEELSKSSDWCVKCEAQNFKASARF